MAPLYANLFVLLIAHPGIGKSVAINMASTYWRNTKHLHIAPATMTKAALIDALKECKRYAMNGTDKLEFASLQVPATEFGNLAPAYDLTMFNCLNDLFDCRDDFIERTRGGGEIHIKNPQVSILGATQPDYLSAMMPETAWGMGFASRIIMVYSEDKSSSRRSLFSFTKPNREDHDTLTARLTQITKLVGEFKWEPEAAMLLDQWHIAGGPPIPQIPRLEHYVTRRTIHLVKLMMIASLSRSDSLVIGTEDFNEALDWLIEAEVTMPEIFRAMVMGGDTATLNDAALWVQEQEKKTLNPVPRYRIIDFLRTRMKSVDVMRSFEIMQNANLIKQTGISPKGEPLFNASVIIPSLDPAPKPKAAPEPDLFASPKPPKAKPESLVPAKYILRVPSDTEEEEAYDESYYETHA